MRESGIPLNTDERSPTTPVSEWQTSQKEAAAFNSKTMNAIFNSTYNLGEIYDQPKIVRKILRSLIEDFRPKVTAIIESKDMDSIPVDELVRSL